MKLSVAALRTVEYTNESIAAFFRASLAIMLPHAANEAFLTIV